MPESLLKKKTRKDVIKKILIQSAFEIIRCTLNFLKFISRGTVLL